jgi:hypothetical protein
MTDVLKHRFVSARADGADVTQVQPSHWNDGHKFQGGAADELLVRDPTDTNFGAKWIAPSTLTPTFDGTVTISSVTGAQHNFALGTTRDVTIVLTGAAGAQFTGIAAGRIGQKVTFAGQSTGVFTFAHQSTSSAVGARLTNPVTSAPTPVAAGGWITFVYLGSVWLLIDHEQGKWITPTFNAANFTAYSTGTWTVEASDVVGMMYRLDGKTLSVRFYIGSTSVTGSPGFLIIAPAGVSPFTPAWLWEVPGIGADAGVAVMQRIDYNGNNYVATKLDQSVWSTATNSTSMFWMTSFEVT